MAVVENALGAAPAWEAAVAVAGRATEAAVASWAVLRAAVARAAATEAVSSSPPRAAPPRTAAAMEHRHLTDCTDAPLPTQSAERARRLASQG